MQYLPNAVYLVWLSYLFRQTSGNYNECHELKASGFQVQKGIEGDYQRSGRCEDMGDTSMYIQTQPAVGWGSYFYLYYFNEPGEYQGWIFSLYPCSDIIFARSSGISHAVSPDLVEGYWEELVTDSYVENWDIQVTCTDGVSLGMTIALIFIGLLSFLVVFSTILLFVKFAKRKRRQRPQSEITHHNQQNIYENDLSMPDAYFPPSPPPYSELNADPLSTPPGYDCSYNNYLYDYERTTNSLTYERLREDTQSDTLHSLQPPSSSDRPAALITDESQEQASSDTTSTGYRGVEEQNTDRERELPPSYDEITTTQPQSIRY